MANYVYRPIWLLGNKSFYEKEFTFKEIVENDYTDGFYKEGVTDPTYRINIVPSAPSYTNNNKTAYYHIGNVVFYRKDGTPILWSDLTPLYQVQYAGDIEEAPAYALGKDKDDNLYEFRTTGLDTYTNGYSNAGSCFGKNFEATSKTYNGYATTECNYRAPNAKGTIVAFIATNNPDVNAIAVSFLIPNVWSATMTGAGTIKWSEGENVDLDNLNLVYQYNNGRPYSNIGNYLRYHEKTVSGYIDGVATPMMSRYLFVKGDKTPYRTWIKDEKNNSEIDPKLYLINTNGREVVEKTINEIRENQANYVADDRLDTGMVEDGYFYNKYPFEVFLCCKKMFNASASGSYGISDGYIISKDGSVLGPFTIHKARQFSSQDNTQYAAITCEDPNDPDNPYIIHLYAREDSQGYANYPIYLFMTTDITSSNSAKSPFISTFCLASIDKYFRIHMAINKEVKAVVLGTYCCYDISGNGCTSAQLNAPRHIGYVKSITHDKVLDDFPTKQEYLDANIKLINNIYYAIRRVFTKDTVYDTYAKVTGYTKVTDPVFKELYIMHPELNNKMVDYDLDLIIKLYDKGLIERAVYKFILDRYYTLKINMYRTFNTNVNKTTIGNMFFIDNKNLAIKNLIKHEDNIYLNNISQYIVETDSTLEESNNIDNLILANEGNYKSNIMFNSNSSVLSITTNEFLQGEWVAFSGWNQDNIEEDNEHFTTKLEIEKTDGTKKLIYDYNSYEEFIEKEFIEHNTIKYGSIYLVNMKTLEYKKGWIRLNKTDNTISTNVYVWYNKKDKPISTRIPTIIENKEFDTTGYTDYDNFKADAYEWEVISGGEYGGALYRVYPVINGNVYKGYTGTIPDGSGSGTGYCTVIDSGIPASTYEELHGFFSKSDINGTMTGLNYNHSKTNPDISLPDQVKLEIKYYTKYVNGSYYRPTYSLGKTESTASYTYFLGGSTSARRYARFSVMDVGTDIVDNLCIDGLIIIPWAKVQTNGRAATKFSFRLYEENNLIQEHILENVTSYRGWYFSADGSIIEITNKEEPIE